MAERSPETEDGPQAPAGPVAPGPGSPADPLAQPPGLEGARACVGAKLDALDGTSVGRIESVLVDASGGEPTWLIARLGRFGRRVAVPYDFVARGVGHAWVPFSRETIKAASELDPVGGLSGADERELGVHFGMPASSGRLAALAELADEDRGSLPA